MNILTAATLAALMMTPSSAAPQGCSTIYEISGLWAVQSTCDETDCGDGAAEQYAFGVSIVQNGTVVDATLPDGSLLSGTLCDDVLTLTGTYPDDGGMTTTTLTLVIAAGQLSLGGSSSWTWNGPGGPCVGTCVVSGNKVLVGSAYCSPAATNSSGLPATITASGSVFVSDADLTLTAMQLPSSQFGYFLAGQTQGGFTPPGSQGVICLSGNIGRYNAIPEIIQGPTGSIALDLAAIPVNPPRAVLPGDTWNFQCWFRDNNPGLTSNFTDGVSVAFL